MDLDENKKYIISGFSMFPLLQNGDSVYLQKYLKNKLQVGDIIAFSNQEQMIAHRVVSISDNNITTQGDNNSKPDKRLLSSDFMLIKSATRRNKRIDLKHGQAGIMQFNKNQKKCKWREKFYRVAKFICRLNPLKVREDSFESVNFGEQVVYYKKDKTIGFYWENHWYYKKWYYAFFIKTPRRVEHQKLFKFIASIPQENTKELLNNLPFEEQLTLLEKARKLGCSPLIYYYLKGNLPEPFNQQFQQDYFLITAWEMRCKQVLNELKNELNANNTPFIILKGGNFAYNYYPTPAVRLRRDIDVLLPKEKTEEIFNNLIQKNWQAHEHLMKKVKKGKRTIFHTQHLPPLGKNGYPCIELHWHFFKNIGLNTDDIWKYTLPTENPNEFRLIPELEYLLLIYNLYYDRWEFACRSLLDLAYLSNNIKLNSSLIIELNEKFNLKLDLGLHYEVFPEFFEEKMFNSKVEYSVIAAIRNMAILPKSNPIESFFSDKELPQRAKFCLWHRSDWKRDKARYKYTLFLFKKLPRLLEMKKESRESQKQNKYTAKS